MSNGGHYEPITDNNNTVLVGTNLHLQVSGGKRFKWSIPDNPFKSYVINWRDTAFDTSGTLTLLGNGDVLDQYVNFAWSDSAESRTVSCTVDTGEQSVLITTKFRVVAPAVTWNLDWTEYPTFSTQSFGVKLVDNAVVTTPVEFTTSTNKGDWNFVQLITDNRFQIKSNGSSYPGSFNGKGKLLDTDYPYDPYPPPKHWTADEASHPSDDFLEGVIRDYEGYSGARIDEKLERYIMYLAPGDSQWVPVRQFDWHINATATLVGSHAEVNSPGIDYGPKPAVSKPPTSFPTWTQLYVGDKTTYGP